MTFKVRLKIPRKSDKKVSYFSEFQHQDGQEVPMFKLVLRLPPEKLAFAERKSDKHLQTIKVSDEIDGKTKDSSETQVTKTQDDEEFESDLSSLDMELNKALSSATSMFSGSISEGSNKFEGRNNKQVCQEAKETKTMKTPRSNHPSDMTEYRHIPSNLTPILRVEFGNDDDSDEEVGILDRITVTLRDPLSASKIKLPLRSSACRHFECFDFDCFCLFNKIPTGIKTLVKKDLAKRNFESKSKGKISLPSYNLKDTQRGAVEIINYPKLQKGKKRQVEPSKLPVYRCPVCNQPFSLGQLYISDVFNYFVKATPKEICRVEIRDMNKYKIVDDFRPSAPEPANANSSTHADDIVILSDDELDDNYDPENLNIATYGQSPPPSLKQETPSTEYFPAKFCHQNHEPVFDQNHYQIPLESNDDVFNDGLDDELVRLSMPCFHPSPSTGTGSWEDPVTID